MDVELKEKWCQALESGDYKQGHDHLCDDGRYCCLGVLADIVDPEGWDHVEGRWSTHRGFRKMPSREFLKRVKLHSTRANSLANYNDDGWSFAELAARIRRDETL